MKQNDILESCLEAIANGATVASCIQLHPTLDDEARTLLYAASRLRTTGLSVTPDASFKRRTRSRLMQRMAADQVMAPPTWQQRLRRFWAGISLKQMQPLAAALVVILVITLGAGAVSAAAKNAEPGSALYPIKRLGEHLQLLAHPDDLDLQVQLAQHRLDEASSLIKKGKTEQALAPLEAHQQIMSTLKQHLRKKNTLSTNLTPALSQQLSEIQRLEKTSSGAVNAHLLTSERLIRQTLAVITPSQPAATPNPSPASPGEPRPTSIPATPGRKIELTPEAMQLSPTVPVNETAPVASPMITPSPSAPLSTKTSGAPTRPAQATKPMSATPPSASRTPSMP